MDYAGVYGKIHNNTKKFPGYTCRQHVGKITALVRETNPRNLLDYGSGKGYQYLARRIHETWGGLLPYCYDVGVRQLAVRPDGKFDGVFCCDVLEHIEEPDINGLLDDIFGYVAERDCATSFVFISVACRPSKEPPLADGRNIHVTIRPPDWWEAKFREAAERRHHPRLLFGCAYDTDQAKAGRNAII